FQDDLDLDLPISSLKKFSTHNPHNYISNDPKTYAYATFLSGHNPSLKDPFYLATHNVVHRVLWAQRSKTTKYPFVVFVAHYVSQEQRDLLSGAGALVRELAPLDWDPHVAGVQKRWKDLFAKLNMWAETEFSRYLFLDADAFPVAHIDEMFDIAPLQDCDAAKLTLDDWVDDAPWCEPYIFAGTALTVGGDAKPEFNCGSMVFTPSKLMHKRLLQNYLKTDRYNVMMSEQGFLNWQFSIDGAFPGVQLDRKWGSIYTKESEEGMMNVLHEKIWWDNSATRGENWLDREWRQGWIKMVKFYESDDFALERAKDG
ncbi:glycosyltransferase family 8 protein, partial [Dothidotthia symphoricarpi CBS 119687]